mmetsp:Transcript_1256/g.2655  ORF Transcript_1256/g.2655 Transcript_1256/m.2655 type:complete len:83 (+) Transcript_1256:293-541(+)
MEVRACIRGLRSERARQWLLEHVEFDLSLRDVSWRAGLGVVTSVARREPTQRLLIPIFMEEEYILGIVRRPTGLQRVGWFSK